MNFYGRALRSGAGLRKQGFTLLEVMIAVAVIAIALVTLLASQSQTISFISEARFMTDAAMLAQKKITELTVAPFADVESDAGEFAAPYAAYRWTVEVKTLVENDTGLSGIDEMLKSVQVTVSLPEDEQHAFTLHAILLRDNSGDASS